MQRYNENAGSTYTGFLQWLKWGAIAVAIITLVVVLLISRG